MIGQQYKPKSETEVDREIYLIKECLHGVLDRAERFEYWRGVVNALKWGFYSPEDSNRITFNLRDYLEDKDRGKEHE